jgi:hypothetical protein
VKPLIEATQFGSITLEGVVYDHDVLVRPDSTVKRRKKKLSKAVYGTSHTISLAEARYVYGQGEGAERLIIGGGQYGRVELSAEAAEYLARTQAVRGRVASHARGDCELERGDRQGDRTVSRHLLNRHRAA